MATRHYNRFEQRSRYVVQHPTRKQHLALSEAQDRNQGVAILLALFLGWAGIHHFYLGNTAAGILSVLFCWTGIPTILGLVNTVQLAVMSKERFAQKYQGYTLGPEQDSVLDAHLAYPTEAVPVRLEEVFQPVFSTQEASHFSELVAVLNRLVQQRQVSIQLESGVKLAPTLLTNTLSVGGGQLPTLTLQAPGASLLFTPTQVVAKRGNNLKVASYPDVVLHAGETHNVVSATSKADTLVHQADALISSLFDGTYNKKNFKHQVKDLISKLERHQAATQPTAPITTAESSYFLTLTLQNVSVSLVASDPHALTELETALRAQAALH